jgi:phage repressor protein C with HTH and peptisase S24 domain
MTELQRIRKVLKWLIFNEYAASEKEIAEKIGYTKSSLSQIINGKVPLSDKFVEKIAAADENINKVWILTGEGYMLRENAPLLSDVKLKTVEDFINIPLVPVRGKAGYLTGYGDIEYIESLPTIPVIVDRAYKGRYRCFEVDGDSMDDGSRESICDKDIVLGREVKRDLWINKLHINDWDFIIVHRDGITIKRIKEHTTDTGIIKCHSLNSLYDDFELHLDKVIEIYNLIKIVDRSARR